jgi:hypothetical protein
VGLKKAMENTSELCEEWIEAYKLKHPEVERFEVPAVQLSLFKGMEER